ncbi:MAG: hypothetical protein QOF81_3508, partial [Acidimicrobiaceae bacterium]|nr:hypothetical protein [Acidimicrobiaceae bacterium]
RIGGLGIDVVVQEQMRPAAGA